MNDLEKPIIYYQGGEFSIAMLEYLFIDNNFQSNYFRRDVRQEYDGQIVMPMSSCDPPEATRRCCNVAFVYPENEIIVYRDIPDVEGLVDATDYTICRDPEQLKRTIKHSCQIVKATVTRRPA